MPFTTQHGEVHPIGQHRTLRFAELPVRNTTLEGHTLREAGLRKTTGTTVVGLWERGTLRPVRPDMPLDPTSVMVVAGTTDQLRALNRQVVSDEGTEDCPVLVIGGGAWGARPCGRSTSAGCPCTSSKKSRAAASFFARSAKRSFPAMRPSTHS